jgi:hypothetical protein
MPFKTGIYAYKRFIYPSPPKPDSSGNKFNCRDFINLAIAFFLQLVL